MGCGVMGWTVESRAVAAPKLLCEVFLCEMRRDLGAFQREASSWSPGGLRRLLFLVCRWTRLLRQPGGRQLPPGYLPSRTRRLSIASAKRRVALTSPMAASSSSTLSNCFRHSASSGEACSARCAAHPVGGQVKFAVSCCP